MATERGITDVRVAYMALRLASYSLVEGAVTSDDVLSL